MAKNRGYGRRNYSELGVQRYQKIFGESLHAGQLGMAMTVRIFVG